MEPKSCIVATAKNEGPFVIEWLAHHLALGFDKIFVATNDCDDGTDALLSALAQVFPVFRIDNSVQLKGQTIQGSAVKRCLAHPEMSDQRWALHIDLDEFLDITEGPADVRPFIADYERFDSVSICWKTFGDNNRAFWGGGSVLDTFLTCAEFPQQAAGIKNFFKVGVFGGSAPHCPKLPKKPVDEIRSVTTRGALLGTEPLTVGWMTSFRLQDDDFTWAKACINHYVHKSHDLTALARHFRGDANGRESAIFKRTVGHPDYERFNRNDVVDTAIQRTRDRRIALMNEMFQVPDVRTLHYRAVGWYFDRIQEVQSRAP